MGAVGTVLWKEVREQYLRGGRPAVTLVVTGCIIVVFGLVLPFVLAASLPQAMRLTVVTGTLLGGVGIVSLFAMMQPLTVVVDAIAGERERHTLETLLATPLPDSAIVLGKAGAVLLVVAAQTTLYVACATISAVSLLGLPGILLAGLVLVAAVPASFLAATYTTGLGLLLSLRAPTVKQGQQWLGYAMMPFFFLTAFSGSFARVLFPKLTPLGLLVIGIVVAVVFLGLNALWWTLLLARFRRDRLLAKSA